ncbi:MAG: M20/M25/M40 family metallo-hydrolase [Pseudomonadota bacterium]
MTLDTPQTLEAVLDQIDADKDAALERLFALLRIPSISTDPAYNDACDEAAALLVADLQSLGAVAEARQTPGRAIVIGHIDGPDGADVPHFLFYGHYDVQPVDPLDLWHRDPFDPMILDTDEGPVIAGRGTSDDKGQLMTFVEACRAWKTVHGTLPCKITFLFEGEEESGSPSIIPFLERYKDELSVPDIALICDTGLFDFDTPAICASLRGLVGEEVIITGPDRDLHSGAYGGPAINPNRVLARVIASLHDDNGRVTIPHFYDGVQEVRPEIMEQWNALGFDAEATLGAVGLSVPAGEQDRSVLEMIWSRPTCEVNGMTGGYTGDGFKTVLPSQARAKISFRLVGTQDPHAIRENFRAMVRAAIPADCSVEFLEHGAGPASVMDTTRPEFEAARKAVIPEWPKPAAFVGGGGSIPIAGYFQTILGLQSILLGFGRDNDNLHSPNEKYDVRSFTKGARSWARVLAALSDPKP